MLPVCDSGTRNLGGGRGALGLGLEQAEVAPFQFLERKQGILSTHDTYSLLVLKTLEP